MKFRIKHIDGVGYFAQCSTDGFIDIIFCGKRYWSTIVKSNIDAKFHKWVESTDELEFASKTEEEATKICKDYLAFINKLIKPKNITYSNIQGL